MKCKITLGGDAMKIERDERKFDFHGIGLAVKKAREREGMTQEPGSYTHLVPTMATNSPSSMDRVTPSNAFVMFGSVP